jgi:hypothetical protein
MSYERTLQYIFSATFSTINAIIGSFPQPLKHGLNAKDNASKYIYSHTKNYSK